MDSNRLCLDEHYQFTDKGVTALCEGLKGSAVTTLRCAVGPKAFAFLSMPIDTLLQFGSLSNNQLCGLNWHGEGSYTAEGITKLCEGLKGSAVTTLKCAAAPRVCVSAH